MLKTTKYPWIYLMLIPLMISCNTGNKSKSIQTAKFPVPVNPKTSREAKRLLEFIYEIHGEYTIAGQHNYLGKMSVYSDSIFLITGKYPGLWGGDYGFADSTHDIDNIKYRPLLVPEIVKQHKRGSLITLTYHQADPTIGEPCPFVGGVQTKLSDQQWQELLTDGTEINQTWKTYVDRLANELKQLQQLKIPVLFRPYHEMNGKWFWWGGRSGDEGFIALWKMLYHYYTDTHQLNNLIWVWSPDKPWHGLKEFYPGDAYVDLVSLDIYPEKDTNSVFRPEWYAEIKEIANQRPFAIGECSRMPSVDELKIQSGYAWFMLWSDLGTKENSNQELIKIFNAKNVLTADEVLKMRGY